MYLGLHHKRSPAKLAAAKDLIKKLACILLFTAVLLPVHAIAAPSTAQIKSAEDRVLKGVNQLFFTVSSQQPQDGGFPTSFGGSSSGEDLYETIYKKIRSAGSDLAIEEVIESRQISREDALSAASGRFIPDLLTNPNFENEKLSSAEITARFNAIREELVDLKEFMDFQVDLSMEVVPTEIFANGSEDDSGFDLMTDLDIIDLILFGDTATQFGSGRSNAHGASQARDPAGASPQPVPRQAGAPQTGVARVARAGANQAAEEDDDEEEDSPAISPEAQAAVAASAGIVCPLNTNFHNAVVQKIAQEEQRAAVETTAIPAQAGIPTGGSRSSRQGRGSGRGLTNDDRGGSDALRALDNAINGAADLSLCDESKVFCLTVDMVYRKATSYPVSRGCIACHIEHINKLFRKTISKSQLPNKASGNLFEIPMCKGGSNWSIFSVIDFNFITVPNPIVTPPNTDLKAFDFARSAEKLCRAVAEDPRVCIPKKIKKPSDIKRTDSDKTEDALNAAGPQTKQSDIVTQVQRYVDEKRTEKLKEFETFKTQASAAPQAAQYQDILIEMDTMNNYFKSFQKIMQDAVNPEDSGSPCQILIKKPSCSS